MSEGFLMGLCVVLMASNAVAVYSVRAGFDAAQAAYRAADRVEMCLPKGPRTYNMPKEVTL